MSFTVVCVFPSQQTKLDMAPSYHGGRRGRSLTELRITEVNILQVRAFEHMSFSGIISFAINCQNVL